MKTTILLTSMVLSLSLVLSGCYSKRLVMQAEMVSMTQKDSGDVKKLKSGKSVEEKWCAGDNPVTDIGSKDYGMADQVIYKAQAGGKAGDFISNARLFIDTNNCMLVEGNLVKLP